MTYQRDMKENFLEYNKYFKAVLLTGPRQVGKTTFLQEIKEKTRKYVTLDDLETRSFAKTNPKEFLKIYSPPVIIDEIQYVPDLMSYIKIICDNTNEKGLFWLTGSQKIELMKGVSESLAGRMGVAEMNSFTYREINKSIYSPVDFNDLTEKENIDKQTILKNILNGGMPAFVLEENNRKKFFESYINLYLERDIRELKQIEDLNSFYKFLISIASRAGQLLNYRSIANDTEKDEKTVKSWVSILEATGIIRLIYPLRKEELKRVTSTPKIIFMDSGICTYLCGIDTIKTLEEYTNFGFLFENYIISELLKINDNYELGNKFNYYRDKDGNEIDLVIKDNNNHYHPYEIKYTAKPDLGMIKSFKKLEPLDGVRKGGIICNSKNLKDLTPKNQIIPVGYIIS